MIAIHPRTKLIALAACVALLAAAAVIANGSATNAARIVLGGSAVAGLAWWAMTKRSAAGRFARTPRLQVVQKVGLSPRAGVALVEVDGRSFLIVHGDGGTRIRRVSSRAAVMAHAVKEHAS